MTAVLPPGTLIVSPMSGVLAAIDEYGATDVLSLGSSSLDRVNLPPSIRTKHIVVNDVVRVGEGIIRPVPGLHVPAEEHVAMILEFVEGWDQRHPMIVHCFAGISRSPAAAYIAMCSLFPPGREMRLAGFLREKMPWVYPNPLLIAAADSFMKREGRMVAAVKGIGMGQPPYEGRNVVLVLPWGLA